MKQIAFFLSLVFMLAIFMGCAKKSRHHEADLPDPKLFEANFYDIDTNGDGKITSSMMIAALYLFLDHWEG